METIDNTYLEAVEAALPVVRAAVEAGAVLPTPEIDPIRKEVRFAFDRYVGDQWWMESDEKRTTSMIASLKKAARVIGGQWAKNDPKASNFDDVYYRLTSKGITFGEYALVLSMDRNAICERVVVGTRTVEHAAEEAQPAKEAWTEELPVYARECGSLADAMEKALAAELDIVEDAAETESEPADADA